MTAKLAPAQAMIGDFESGAPDSWYGWDDGSSKTTLEVRPPGAGGTHFAAHVRGGPYLSWGGAMTLILKCMDVSDYGGLELWMKAESHTRVRIQFQMPKTTGISHRDDCKFGCAPPAVEVEPGSEWRQYAIPFDSFRAPKGVKLGRVINSIDIQAPRAMDLWVDQIRFYKGAPDKSAAVL